MKPGLILAARMGSQRLPGKSMREVLGVPLIAFMIRRLRASRYAAHFMLAIPEGAPNDVLADLAAREGVACFRGDEKNVLKRLVDAAGVLASDCVVRLYGDSPLTDPAVVDRCVEIFLGGGYDLVTTKYTHPMGIDCEVVGLETLRKILETTQDPYDLEHVTAYLWKNRNRYRGLSVPAPEGMAHPEYVLTVDDEKGFRIFESLVRYFKGRTDFSGQEIVNCLERHLEWIVKRSVPQGF